MSLENEILQQDAQIPESSAPEQTSDSNQQTTDTSQEHVAQTQSEDNTPFHKHPRWQEMMERSRAAEERNSQYERQMEQYQRQLGEMEKRFQSFNQPQKPANPFVEKLKEIDPRYGEWAESMESRASKAEQLENDLKQLRYERLVEKYESSVDRLHNDLKTPAEVRELVKSRLDALAQTGQVNLQNLQQAYKAEAEKYTKLVDQIRRAERESYTKAKAADTQAPTAAPKGAPVPNRNQKGQFTGDRERDLAAISKRVMRLAKGESDI